MAVRDGVVRLAAGAGRRVAIDGAFLAPGFVESAGRAGYLDQGSEQTREMTSGVDARDLVDPLSSAFEEGALEGCTTIVATPAANNLIGGLTQAFHTWSPARGAQPIDGAPKALAGAMGQTPSRGNFPPRGGPTTSIYARRPTTRMGVMWMLRQTFLAAKGVQEPPDSADLAHYREVLAGRRTFVLRAHAIQDMNAAVRLAEETGLSFVLEGAEEGYLVRAKLGERRTDVLCGPLPDIRTGRGPEFTDTALRNAVMLRDAGCRVALTSGDSGPRWLREQAMFATRYGFTRDEALAAVTSIPADILGLTRRGRIEDGAAGDVVLWSGHPLLPASRMLMVVIDGRVVFDRTAQE